MNNSMVPLRRAEPLPSVSPPCCWSCNAELDNRYQAYRQLRHQRISKKDALDHPSVGLAVDPYDGLTQLPCCRDMILSNHCQAWIHTLLRGVAEWAEGRGIQHPVHVDKTTTAPTPPPPPSTTSSTTVSMQT